jgi:hypothetical protein
MTREYDYHRPFRFINYIHHWLEGETTMIIF